MTETPMSETLEFFCMQMARARILWAKPNYEAMARAGWLGDVPSEAELWRAPAISDRMYREMLGLPLTKPHPDEDVGLPCPFCRVRPAIRHEYDAEAWRCRSCGGTFTLAEVLRYLWNRKS